MIDEENECWECFLCATEYKFAIFPSAYLSNFHPLCKICADTILNDQSHSERIRLTYYDSIGDLKMLANIPVQKSYQRLN